MKAFSEQSAVCPHCGHTLRISLDSTNGSQDFYDDCTACCHPIHFYMVVDELNDCIELTLDADDEQIF